MNCFGFCLPEGEQMLGYPIAVSKDERTRGDAHYNFVWYRPASQAGDLRRLYTDITGARRETPPPPGRIHPDVVRTMREDAAALLSPQFAEVVAVTRDPFVQAIYDLESPRLVDNGVVLIGDAAFVARPHVGMGVTKAAGDAAALALAIDEESDLSSALSRFDLERSAIGKTVLTQARRLGAYMQAQIGTEEERTAAARYRNPVSVMRETASVRFLREGTL
jgi:2-polyprenyl-6-methoxyphenol hydroxylase-like FAD-dependent oxidoreductase